MDDYCIMEHIQGLWNHGKPYGTDEGVFRILIGLSNDKENCLYLELSEDDLVILVLNNIGKFNSPIPECMLNVIRNILRVHIKKYTLPNKLFTEEFNVNYQDILRRDLGL